MKKMFKLLVGRSRESSLMRKALVSLLLVYVLTMAFISPTINSIAEAVDLEIKIYPEQPESTPAECGFGLNHKEAALPNTEVNVVSPGTWSTDTLKTTYVVREEVEKRTINSKVYYMSDGSHVLFCYPTAIHYADGNTYEEIDNTLVLRNNRYENKNNILHASLPSSTDSDRTAIVTFEEYELSFSLVGDCNSFTPISLPRNYPLRSSLIADTDFEISLNNQSSVSYGLFNNQVELEQMVVGTQFKENIILNSPQSGYEFEFMVSASNLELSMSENGDIIASNGGGEEVFIIPKGYMFDAVNNYSDNVEYELEPFGEDYKLRIVADDSWINCSERVFPVTIDPTVQVSENSLFISASRGKVSNNLMPVNINSASFIDFELPETISNATIIGAEMCISAKNENEDNYLMSVWANNKSFTAGNAPEKGTRNVPDATQEWQTVVQENCYFDDTTGNYTPAQQIVVVSQEFEKYFIDMTRIIKNYVDFDRQDEFYGVAFTSQAASNIYIANESYQDVNLRPYVQIQYRDMVGLESYWDYEEHPIGNDVLFINKYNGAVTVTHNDLSIESLPSISINHIYLENYSDTAYNIDGIFAGNSFGLGWKLNYQQLIRQRGSDYEYYDADGTMHYLIYNSIKGYCEDEDGLGLKLYLSPYKMVDKQNNKMYFDYHGRMYKIEDNNGEIINIKYGNGNQGEIAALPITEINNGRGTVLNFLYSETGLLAALTYKRADGSTPASTTFTYDASDQLVKITHDDGTYSAYTYSEFSISNENGNALRVQKCRIYAPEDGINVPAEMIETYTTMVKTVNKSYDGTTWEHVSDNIFCDGLTITVHSLAGEEYVPYLSYEEFNQQMIEELNDLIAAEPDLSVRLGLYAVYLLLLVGYLLVKAPAYAEECKDYYDSNFQINSVYDSCGRLVSEYIAGEDVITSVQMNYGNTDAEGVDVNNNKIQAAAVYTSNAINYLKNGSFENGATGWSTSETDNSYCSTSISTQYSSHGDSALEMYRSQPTQGELVSSQQIALEGGNYTLSANVRIAGLLIPYSSSAPYGAKIRVRQYVESEYIAADVYTVNNGFRQVQLKFEVLQKSTIYVDLMLVNCSGFAYFDGVQLLKSAYGVDSSYNYADNTGFEEWSGALPSGWMYWTDTQGNAGNTIEKLDADDTLSGNFGVKIKGRLDGSINLYQHTRIEVSSQPVAYTLSIWANTKGATYLPLTTSAVQLNYNVIDSAGSSMTGFVAKMIKLPFAAWHQVAMTFIAPAGAAIVEINIQIRSSTSELLVDNVSLVKSQIINLEYDEAGNNVAYSDGVKVYDYDEDGNEISIGKDGRDKYGVIKDANGNVLVSKDFGRQVQMAYTYDSRGRVLTETLSSLVDGEKTISSQTSYEEIASNLTTIVTETDSLGFETVSDVYTYSSLLKKTTFNDGSYIEYEYRDGTISSEQFPGSISKITITSKAPNGTILSVSEYEYFTINDELTDPSYGYRHVGALKKITFQNGTEYSYVYDVYGNVVTTKLNGVPQSTMVYRSSDGVLMSKTYGADGYSEYYYYDELGRMIEMRATASYTSDAVGLSDDALVKHVYYIYDLGGKITEVLDTIANKGYWYIYDANGNCILSGEGIYDADDNNSSIITETVYESIYDMYGGIYAENIIDLSGVRNTYGVAALTTSLSGALSHVNASAEHKIFVDDVEKIKFRLAQNGYSLREDNVLLDKTFHYTLNRMGKIENILVGDYSTAGTAQGISYDPFYSFRTVYYKYDSENGNLWSIDWAIANQNPACSEAGRMVIAEDSVYNGQPVTDVVRLKQESMFSTSQPYGYYSLVSPDLLKLGGDSVSLSYLIRRVAVNSASPTVAGLRFRYTDGTCSEFAHIPMDTEWHSYSLTCAAGKTVAAIELPWYYDATLEIGNIVVTSDAIGKIDERFEGITLSNSDYVLYDYDALGRVSKSTVKNDGASGEEIFSEQYSYIDGTGNTTSYTVNEITVAAGDTVIANYGYVYNMHANGTLDTTAANPYNIYQVKENGVIKVEYFYDGFGRLFRENNSYTGKTVVYAYDSNNNITSKTIYQYTAGNGALSGGVVTTYVYGDTLFKDRLTAYNGQSIVYDNGASNGIGLPTSYLGKTMQWMGRELIGISEGTDTFSYSYDSNGIRTSKTINGVLTEYLYSETQLLRQVTGSNTIWFVYDQDGMIGFELNGTPYYYVRNIMNDVASIIDASGNVVVNYIYDSWGKLLSVTGSHADTVGALNPIRYRGYYYDTETGFYYLNSRYYDAETGRFISADVLSEDGNLYVYCQNDPINRSDESGYLSKAWKRALVIAASVVAVVATVAITAATGGAMGAVLVGAVAGGLLSAGISAAAQYATTGTVDIWEVVTDGAIGAVFGAVGGTALGAGGLAMANAGLGAASSMANDWIDGNEIDWGKTGGSAVLSAVVGGIGGGAQNGLTGARQAALSTQKQIAQKFASGGYRTYNNYLFAKGSNALRLKSATSTLNKLAIANIFKNYAMSLEVMVYQEILLG